MTTESKKGSAGRQFLPVLRLVFGIVFVTSLVAEKSNAASSTSQRKIPDPVEPELVAIDQSEPSYTVFLAIPKDGPEDMLQELRSKISQETKATLKPWNEFLGTQKSIFNSQIVRNEYPESRVQEGITELLRRYPGIPFGLTWTGGVAFTYSDYQHAKETYKDYLSDPEAHVRTRPKDPRADPIKPEWHFGPLLGWTDGKKDGGQ